MEANTLNNDFSCFDQLIKYAKDLSEIYGSEQEKRNKLEDTAQQLLEYAKDLNRSYLDLKVARKELQAAYLDTIYRLVLAAEYKDEDTGDHIIRMSQYCALIAEKLGLSLDEVQKILYAAPMHDVGKIGIPDNILMKPGKLTEEEFAIVKTHTIIGAKILENSKSEILSAAEEIAISHHEKWDGTGYPRGLSGTNIPLAGRIASLADVFDALCCKRPYKDPFPIEVVLEIIKKERGKQFDPDILDVFLEHIDEILKIKAEVEKGDNVVKVAFLWNSKDQEEDDQLDADASDTAP